jgi:hypothetical protein
MNEASARNGMGRTNGEKLVTQELSSNACPPPPPIGTSTKYTCFRKKGARGIEEADPPYVQIFT